MSKHTPGPWDWFIGKPNNKQASREPQMRLLIGSNGQGFAHTVGLSREEDEANVRLIAAAPQMLEALKAARPWIAAKQNPHDDHCAFVCNGGGECDCPVPAIDDAIKLAEGE